MHVSRFIFLLTIASWLSLVSQWSCPQRNLDPIFACPHMFSIWVQHEGLWMGLGPFAVWQMVDYPNKRTNYLGFPSATGHCWEQYRAQKPDLPTVGQLASWAARTLALSYFLASSSSLHFLSLPGFTGISFYSLLSHLATSQSVQTDLGGLLFQHNSSSLFRWRLFMALIRGQFKVNPADGLILIDFSSPSFAPCKNRLNYDEKANKWPMFNQNLL